MVKAMGDFQIEGLAVADPRGLQTGAQTPPKGPPHLSFFAIQILRNVGVSEGLLRGCRPLREILDPPLVRVAALPFRG